MQRVFIVTSHAPSAINFRAPLIQSLVIRGCTVTVLAPNHSAETQHKLESLGASIGYFPLTRAGLSPLADLGSLISLLTIFRKNKPDVVLTYFVKPNIWAILAAALAGVRRRVAMVEGMGYAFTQDSTGHRTLKQIIIGWLILRLYQVAFLASSRVIVLNQDDMRDLQKSCGLQPRKAFLLGGIGVLLDQWQMQEPIVDPMTFTMVARLLREKGVFEFLGAAKLIKSEFPWVRFLLLGGLDDNPGAIKSVELQPWIDEGCVEILGHVNVLPWLSMTSVFILPSYREGVPRSTQEAMALGLPVITTDVPGCRETVVEGVNGFLVPPRDSLKLAQSIKNFILRPELIGQMGPESRRLAEERFDIRKANNKIIEVLGL